MGGKFGEMSTLMNYTFQSFNFRYRQGARPFYDLIANIAAEEYGHIELVAATINTMLTGVSSTTPRTRPYKQHYLFGGKGALPADSHGKPWDGSYVHSSGDLVEDLTHNYFLETGARSGKLRVYEMCDHPAARALTGYLLVRGGVHQVAYARALENLTGADMSKLFPTPRIPTAKIPECQPHIEKGEHLKLYRFSPNDYREIVAVFNGVHPETGEELEVVDEAPEGFPPNDLPPQRPTSSRPTTRPRRSPRSRRSCARPPACRTRSRASSPTTKSQSPGRGGRACAARVLCGRRCGRPPRAGCG